MRFFKKITCSVCGRRFSKEEDIMNHSQTVHGSPQYDCRECDRYFASMEAMRTHLQREHSYKSDR